MTSRLFSGGLSAFKSATRFLTGFIPSLPTTCPKNCTVLRKNLVFFQVELLTLISLRVHGTCQLFQTFLFHPVIA